MNRVQELVDATFQLVSMAATNPTVLAMSNEERMAWVAEQLDACGFPTKPCGASWGVLTAGQS